MTTRRGDPYAGRPGRRIFVAVPLAEAARVAIEDLVGGVRSAADPGEREVRWVRLDGIHVTLRFIGPTPEDRIAAAIDAMAAAAAAATPFEARLDGAGAFPSAARPRTLWLAIGAGAGELGGLAQALDRELVARGWPSDDRPFRAHLTLARADGIPSGSRTAERLRAAALGIDVRWQVDRAILFESVTGRGPARYLPLTESSFGA